VLLRSSNPTPFDSEALGGQTEVEGIHSAPMGPDARAELRQLTDLMSRQEDVDLAIVFGSVGAGTAGRDSDVDVAVLTRETMSSEGKQSLIAAIATATGRPVDLVDPPKSIFPAGPQAK
jgi:predicted nucleotidyltransferase